MVMDMTKKIFVSGNYLAAISWVVIALPYVVFLGVIATEWAWLWFLFSVAFSYLLYATVAHRCIRVIVLKDGRIKALPSLTPIDQVQYKVDEALSDVVEATYAFTDGDSHGDPVPRFYEIPTLKITLLDGRSDRILLCGYSKEQLNSLENAIKEVNPDIVFTNEPKVLFRR